MVRDERRCLDGALYKVAGRAVASGGRTSSVAATGICGGAGFVASTCGGGAGAGNATTTFAATALEGLDDGALAPLDRPKNHSADAPTAKAPTRTAAAGTNARLGGRTATLGLGFKPEAATDLLCGSATKGLISALSVTSRFSMSLRTLYRSTEKAVSNISTNVVRPCLPSSFNWPCSAF
jgi:hypothetical protein